MNGYVYVLSNESMPGIYKIGCTSRTPYDRAKDLYTTGVPSRFVVEYFLYIDNYQYIEKLIHKRLHNYKLNKEFFKYDLIKCIVELKEIAKQHSSYKERYRDQHLKSQVEGWENKYIEEKRRRRQEKIKIQREQDKLNNLGCLVIFISIILDIILICVDVPSSQTSPIAYIMIPLLGFILFALITNSTRDK